MPKPQVKQTVAFWIAKHVKKGPTRDYFAAAYANSASQTHHDVGVRDFQHTPLSTRLSRLTGGCLTRTDLNMRNKTQKERIEYFDTLEEMAAHAAECDFANPNEKGRFNSEGDIYEYLSRLIKNFDAKKYEWNGLLIKDARNTKVLKEVIIFSKHKDHTEFIAHFRVGPYNSIFVPGKGGVGDDWWIG